MASKKKVAAGARKSAAPAKKGAVRKAASKVVRAVKRAAAAVKPAKSRNTGSKATKKQAAKTAPRPAAKKAAAKNAPRKVQRKSDLTAVDLTTPTPSQMSQRGPFDKPRGARFRDVEAADAVVNTNEQWAEEDQFTNRTGDKRIGTRGRKYEE
jgi:hypothetical protein